MAKQQSTNKTDVQFIKLDQQDIPSPIESVSRRDNYVSFGDNNQYPNFIYDAYCNSSVLQSIINGLTDYICGSGFVREGSEENEVNKHGDTLMDIVKKCTLDYIIFGAFALQVIRNSYHRIVEVYYVDVRKVRISPDEDDVYINQSLWETNKGTIKFNRAWKDNASYADTDEIFYYSNPKSRGVYGLPIWHSAIKDVITSMNITIFHMQSIRHNFNANCIISFNNGVPSEEDQKRIERAIKDKFCGSENSSNILLTFANDKEHGVEINRISEDGFDQRYQALAKSVTNNIFTSFRAQPQLFGLDPERTAFNSIEYQDSFLLFKETVVKPLQSEIEKAFAKLSDSLAFELKEFSIKFEEHTTAIQPTYDQNALNQ